MGDHGPNTGAYFMRLTSEELNEKEHFNFEGYVRK